LVTSGTATLETALLNTPLVLGYRSNALSYSIAKAIVNVNYIGLPNLILEKQMIKELIQKELTKENIEKEIDAMLHDQQKIASFEQDQKALKQAVGEAGASTIAANRMFKLMTA